MGVSRRSARERERAVAGYMKRALRRLGQAGRDPSKSEVVRLREIRDWMMRLHDVAAMTRWMEHATLATNPLVSVVLPTTERPEFLERAIRSVIAQRYSHWQLVVVEDGGESHAHDLALRLGDDRIEVVRIERSGVCGARNRALQECRGELVAYLDDDNVMDPLWLKSVVWAFETRPDAEALYGAFVIDDFVRAAGRGSGAWPRIILNPWSEDSVVADNVTDISAIAHRRGADLAFDPSLVEMGDWDALLQLTRERDPLVVPAIACYYTTDAPRRLSGGPTYAADRRELMARAQAWREARRQ